MNTLHYLLTRYSDNGKSTLGLLHEIAPSKADFCAYTLEDEYRADKVAGDTRIPADVYAIDLRREVTPLTTKYRARFPEWFVWHIEVLDVPGFENVYLHVGNSEKDTAGCILLGDSAVSNRNADGFIGNSTQAFKRWYRKTHAHLAAGGLAMLDIRDESFFLTRP